MVRRGASILQGFSPFPGKRHLSFVGVDGALLLFFGPADQFRHPASNLVDRAETLPPVAEEDLSASHHYVADAGGELLTDGEIHLSHDLDAPRHDRFEQRRMLRAHLGKLQRSHAVGVD